MNNLKVILLAINRYFILPTVMMFTFFWFIFGGLSGSKSNYYITLISGIGYIVISLGIEFKRMYRHANNNSNSKEKVIFFVGMFLLIIALIVFFKLYFKR